MKRSSRKQNSFGYPGQAIVEFAIAAAHSYGVVGGNFGSGTNDFYLFGCDQCQPGSGSLCLCGRIG